MIKQRSFLSFILLTLITCGLYAIFWAYQTASETNTIFKSNDSDPVLYALLAFFLMPVYVCIMAQKIHKNAYKVGVHVERTWVFHMLMWVLSPLTCGISSFFSYYYLINDFNLISFAYNNSNTTNEDFNEVIDEAKKNSYYND